MPVDLSDSPLGLFSSLFRFIHRESGTPKENFLSEIFGYVLRTSEGARDAWVSYVLGRNVHCEVVTVTTRSTETDEESRSVYPDLQVQGTLAGGEPFDILSEHKWGSPCSHEQLQTYHVIAKARNAKLCFIGASRRQLADARRCDPAVDKAFLWEDVFRLFEPVENKSEVLKEFLDFMSTQALNPGKPLSVEQMNHFVKGQGFKKSLERTAHLLLNEFDWDCVPVRYRENPEVTDRFGRIALEFATPDWHPTLSIGFLYDTSDYRIEYVDRQKGMDLVLRLEAGPKERGRIENFKKVIAKKRSSLVARDTKTLVTGEVGLGNSHSMLILQCSLAPLIADKTESGQVDALYSRINAWVDCLYKDGKLEEALIEDGLTSGLPKVKRKK
jgi:hypothetical protein